jgi:chaperonin GroEL
MKIVNFTPQETILSAVEKYSKYISPTYGPAGKGILLSNEYDVRIADDGKIASQEFELENEHENAVVKYIKEVTAKTDSRVGDGTTTSAIIMSEIVKKILTPGGEFEKKKNTRAEVNKLKKGLSEAVKQIKAASKKIKTKEELYEISLNAYNNPEIAKLISDTVFEIGVDGCISIDDSRGMTTDREIMTGMELDKGFISPYLMTEEGKAVIKNPTIVVINKRIDFVNEVVPLVQTIVESGKKDFVIISQGFSEQVVSSFIVNKIRDVFHPLLIDCPGYGDEKLQTMLDIAHLTGARVIDPQKGDTLEKIGVDYFGKAETVTSTKDSTTIVGGGGTKASIQERISSLKAELDQPRITNIAKEKIERRIAKLSGGIAVIRVGAPTENEQRSIKVKVEDSVNATKVAFRKGIVRGGGKTFEEISTSSEVLNNALKAPRKILEENGKEFLNDNVFDPTEVLVASLESAVSIACGLIETGGIVSVKREEKQDKGVKY